MSCIYTKVSGLKESVNHYFKLKFISAQARADILAYFNITFTLPGPLWNQFVVEVINLATGEDLTECGVKCRLHATQCDFFMVDDQICYLALLTETEGGDLVESSKEILSYNHEGIIFKE